MTQQRHYFLCGIGGSGMLPLALILRAKGHAVEGSDRMLDQGGTAKKFEFLRQRGIPLHPQDGSGMQRQNRSWSPRRRWRTACPMSKRRSAWGHPAKAGRKCWRSCSTRRRRASPSVAPAANRPPQPCGLGAASRRFGPHHHQRAVMKNFISPDVPFAGSLLGHGDHFVAEVDESDGSIALFSPRVAVLNNIALDHKSMEELRRLFGDFARQGGEGDLEPR